MKYKKLLFVIMLFPFSLMAQTQSTDIGFQQPNGVPIGIYWKNPGYSKTSAAIRAVDFGSYARQGIGFYTGDFPDRVTSALERMRITRTGNVGIGTSTPSEKLQVKGSLYMSDDSPYIYWNSNSLNLKSKYNCIPVVAVRASESYSSRIDMYKAGDIEKTVMIHTEGNTYFNGGNVGIGTTAPEYKLDVLGTIRARELKVDMQGADFVFEDDYPLRPISELEDFVKTNKHLPEIAPAKEMQANGVNQSEMNQKLLQKIEELTLYTIKQQRQLDIQKKLIEQLIGNQK